jgi:predicted nucleic acid-binding protein
MKLPAGFLYQDAHRPKSPDALHLATANRYACAEFWTNDDRLKQAAADLSVNIFPPSASSGQ